MSKREYAVPTHHNSSPSGGGWVGVATGEDSACGKPHLNPPLKGEEIPGAGQPHKKPTIKHYTRETLRRGRALRSNPTEAEKKLWNHLREEQMEGCKFRRQFFIGKYIADFVCVEKKLVIEADGGQHNDSDYDVRRDAYIMHQGYRIMRFWNNEILGNIEGVVENIRDFLLSQTPPRPSPKRGGSKESL